MMKVVEPSPSSEDHHREHCGSDHEPHRIVTHHPQDELDQRIEESDVDHDSEEDDREEQQRRSGCERLDAVGDHVADSEAGPGK